MSKGMNRTFLVATALVTPLLLAACTGTSNETLRIASHARLTSVDPIASTAYVSRTHGYLVYDTLFATDQNQEPQPQMVERWSTSPDNKTWTFVLRDGLKWQDGTPVTADDCVASLQRWGKRDGMGQQLFKNVTALKATDAKTFVMTLRQPVNDVLESLAKISSNVPFMMPKQVAATDAFTEIKSTIGSGPYIYDAKSTPDDFIYDRNTGYVPRTEPQSMAAGGKVAKFNRIEMVYYANQADAVQALIDGKIDYVESPSTEQVKRLEGVSGVTVASTDPLGNIGMVRFNSLIPPFNNPDIRRAVLMALKQEDYMRAALGDQRYWRTCYSVFPCGTPLSNDAGSDIMKVGNIDAAKKALQAAHYDGTPVVLLNPTDQPVMSAFTKVTADTLQKIGMKVKVEDMDWATLIQRRNNRGSAASGGWNMFHTWWIAGDVADPTSIAFSGDPQSGWYGWPQDAKLEQLRSDYGMAKTAQEKAAIAAKVQERVLAIGAFGVLGQFYEPVAFRSDLQGITSPVQFWWGVSKAE